VKPGGLAADLTVTQTLLAPGDEMVVMPPNYMQIWGLGDNYGMRLKPFHLREELGWAPDLDELNDAVSERTKLIAVCNPNNLKHRRPVKRHKDGRVSLTLTNEGYQSPGWLVSR